MVVIGIDTEIEVIVASLMTCQSYQTIRGEANGVWWDWQVFDSNDWNWGINLCFIIMIQN